MIFGTILLHARIQIFFRGGPTLTTFFLDDEGWEDIKYLFKRAIIGPPAKAASETFRWRADDSQTLNAGSVAS